MNHALYHSPFPLDYPLAPEQEFLGQARAYSNNSTLPAHLNRFLRNDQGNGEGDHPLATSPSPAGQNSLAYTAQQATLPDAASQSAAQLLSPPESCSGSGSIGSNSAASPYPYTALPALYENNATGAETSNAVSSFPPQPFFWTDRNMSDHRQRVTALPPPNLSPSTSHGTAYPMPSSSVGSRLLGDLNPPSGYHLNRPGFPPLMSHDQDLPGYGNLNAPARPLGALNNSFPPQIPSYNPTMPGVTLDQDPRNSNLRAQDGPPFEETKAVCLIVTARNQQVTPKIDARIQKGFFKVDHKWTCYRRNYFTVSCSFSLKPSSCEAPFYLQRHANQQHEQINAFAVQISAKTAVVNNQESELRILVQHTPKRNKETESVPEKVIVQPAQPSILTNPPSYHGGGGTIYGAATSVPSGMMVDYNPQQYNLVHHQGPPQSHTFERIQFQKATANNGKRRAQQQYFHVVVELFGDVGRHGGKDWVKVATAQSHPMVVRGRSPGHYRDNRRDSSTSMDPDRGAGAGGEGSGGSSSLGTYLGSSQGRSSTMNWEPTQRGPSQVGNYRHAAENCSADRVKSLEPSNTCNFMGELDSSFARNEPTMHSPSIMAPVDNFSDRFDQEAAATLLRVKPETAPGNPRSRMNGAGSYLAASAAERIEPLHSVIRPSRQVGAMEIPLHHQTLCS